MDDASPPKWHLAHTTWFFETFLLKPFATGYQPFHPQFEYLFNSYYNGVGAQYPRPRRGLMSRPTVAEVLDYRRHVDEAMADLLDRDDPEVRQRLVLGLHHEQQHQELLLTDIKYNLGNNPLRPAYRHDLPGRAAEGAVTAPGAPGWVEFDGGVFEIGSATGTRFCFDNETPRHQVLLRPYRLADRLVTNGEFLEFVESGAYQRPELWLSDAWSALHGRSAPGVVEADPVRGSGPLYWYREDGCWFEYQLAGPAELVPDAPVTHISFYEADAFARWCGKRLPTEQEWEHAAAAQPVQGNFADAGRLQPAAAPPPVLTDGAAPLRQIYGDVWEWTASPYGPYPGYQPLAGTLGEYNGKFMSNQLVLRGGSCVTQPGHVRAGYRNFFYPGDRWQFSGIRLASDAG